MPTEYLRSPLTLGDVAEANNGNNPPQAMIRLSDNCDIR